MFHDSYYNSFCTVILIIKHINTKLMSAPVVVTLFDTKLI